jgi:transcription elongation factor Elf1
MQKYHDLKYVGLISNQLQHFKIKKQNPYLATFRCPFCGDSQKKKFKTRGYFYEEEDHLQFKCHNCSKSMPFKTFLWNQDTKLYGEYKLDSIKDSPSKPIKQPHYAFFEKPKFSTGPLKTLKKISSLRETHGAKQYVVERKIPVDKHHTLYYCPKFYAWVNSIVPGKFSDKVLAYDEPRLIIPFLDQQGELFGFQGRSFRKNTDLRYITIMLDENKPKVFGLNTVDFTKPFFVVEGPIDSLFLPNCIAMAGSDVDLSLFPSEKMTVVYDNEPRNKEIILKMEKAIEQGYRVCVWPQTIEYKDINDMLMKGGMSSGQIRELISSNSSNGLRAKLALTVWKKCE